MPPPLILPAIRSASVECTQALSVLESPVALKREQSKLLAFEILCTAAITHKKVRGVEEQGQALLRL